MWKIKIAFYSAIFLKVTNLKVFAESKKGHFANLSTSTQPRTGLNKKIKIRELC